MGVGQCLARATLAVVNFILCVAALSALIFCLFTVPDVKGDYLLKKSLFTIVMLGSIVVLVISIFGCWAALASPSKRCARVPYLIVLLAALVAEVAGVVLVFNFCNVLDRCKAHDVDIEGNLDQATAHTMQFLHDQVLDLYDDGNCTGGEANGTELPIGFKKVRCTRKPVGNLFDVILEGGAITSENGLDRFTSCTRLPSYTPPGQKSSSATQAFCGSEEYIVAFASRHIRQLRWLPVTIVALTVVLFLATLVLVCKRDRRRVSVRSDARLDLLNSQLAQRMV